MSAELLLRHREVWQRKPVLRKLYADWYEDICAWLMPGRTVELGGGSGNLKERLPNAVCTDLVPVPWLDLQADAQHLPFRGGTVSNLVLFDALHHIENVRLFFDEAIRVLRSEGRIIIMDPYVSLMSWPVYRFLHPEPLDLTTDPLCVRPRNGARQPFDANQAVATILFGRGWPLFRRAYPTLTMLVQRRLAFFAYPLSGGFDHPSLLPDFLLGPMLALERRLGSLGRMLAFRILVVLQKA